MRGSFTTEFTSDPDLDTDHYLKRELYERIQSDPKFFDFLQAGSLDGIWYWDLDQPDHEWMSPEFWQQFGYEPSKRQHLASEWQDLIHPDDLEAAKHNFERHLEDPFHPYDQIVRYRHRLGHWVSVRCRGLAIRDTEGRPRRMLGVHTDVTSLVHAQEALQHQVKRLEAVSMRLEMERTRRQLCEDKLRKLEERLAAFEDGAG